MMGNFYDDEKKEEGNNKDPNEDYLKRFINNDMNSLEKPIGGAQETSYSQQERGFSYGLDAQNDSGGAGYKPVQNPYSAYGNSNSPKQKSNKGWIAFLVIVFVSLAISIVAITGVYVFNYVDMLESNKKDEIINEEYTPPPLDENKPTLGISDRPTNPVFQTPTNGMTIPEIAEKVRPAVVGIVSEGQYETYSGSGMIMTEDGYIITNAHVVDGKNITVITKDEQMFKAELVGKDKKTDLCVIKVNAVGLPTVEFGKSDELVVGEVAVAVGNPLGMELFGSVTAGIISAVDREINYENKVMKLIQTDASINPGNSGGPLVNGFGQVIGINTIKIGMGDYEGLGFAIPISEAKPIIDNLLSFGYVPGRPVIGISGNNVEEFYSSLYDLPRGVYVILAQEGSDAYEKGLVKGDIIVAINGVKVTSMNELNREKDKKSAGDTVELSVYRGGKTFDVQIKLMEAGPEA